MSVAVGILLLAWAAIILLCEVSPVVASGWRWWRLAWRELIVEMRYEKQERRVEKLGRYVERLWQEEEGTLYHQLAEKKLEQEKVKLAALKAEKDRLYFEYWMGR